MHKKLSFGLAAVVAIGLLGCSDNAVEPGPGISRDLTLSERQLVESDKRFAFKIFKEIVEEDKDKNVFISPLSISMALAMTYNGARESTREAMHSTLEFGDLTIQEVNESFRSLIDLLTLLDPKVRFQIANSIWYREGFSVEQEFLDVNTTYFDAVVEALDFSSRDAVETINGWVEDKTNGKIE